MASIQRRTSKAGVETYRVGYRDAGKLHWTPAITTAEGAVEMKSLVERLGPAAALAILDQRSGRDAHHGPPLLSEMLDRHLAAVASHGAGATAPDYRAMAERTWLPSLGPLPVDAITRETVEKWVAAQRDAETHRSARRRDRARAAGEPEPPRETYSPKSIANAHGLLSSVLARAVEDGHVTKNLARGVPLPRDRADAEREIFTEAEFAAFWDAMQEHYRPLVAFLVATGVRIGEATAVQVRDLELGGATPYVRIRRAWKKGETGRYLGAPKSRRANRTLLLDPSLLPILAPLIENRTADDYVFTAAEGGVISPVRFRERQWQAAMERAGITKHLTPHSLRHTSASWQLMGGVAPQVVQHRLGHESLATTSKVYAHLLVEAQVAAAAVTGRVLAPQIEP